MVLMTISEYARLHGITRRAVWVWIRKGAVRVQRVAPKTGVRILLTTAEARRLRTLAAVRERP